MGQMPILLENPSPKPVKYIVGSQLKAEESSDVKDINKSTSETPDSTKLLQSAPSFSMPEVSPTSPEPISDLTTTVTQAKTDEKKSTDKEEPTADTPSSEITTAKELELEKIEETVLHPGAESSDIALLDKETASQDEVACDLVKETSESAKEIVTDSAIKTAVETTVEAMVATVVEAVEAALTPPASSQNEMKHDETASLATGDDSSVVSDNVAVEEPKLLPPEIANIEKIIPESDSDKSDSDSSSSSSSSESDDSSSEEEEEKKKPEEIIIEDDDFLPEFDSKQKEVSKVAAPQHPTSASVGLSKDSKPYSEIDSKGLGKEMIEPSESLPILISLDNQAHDVVKSSTEETDENFQKEKMVEAILVNEKRKIARQRAKVEQDAEKSSIGRRKQTVAKNKVSMVTRIFRAKKKEEKKVEVTTEKEEVKTPWNSKRPVEDIP